jgi:hypothetical protein
MARMNEKAEKHLMMVVPKGATVVVVRASAILAGISLALAFLAILTSAGLGKPHVGLAWERVFWGGAVVSALLAFGIQLCSRGRVVLWWPADLFSATPSAATARLKSPLRLQYTTRSLFAFVTASALLVVFFSLPDDFQELIIVLALVSPAVGCIFYVALASQISTRHVVLLVVAVLQLVAVAALFGPWRSWFWR